MEHIHESEREMLSSPVHRRRGADTISPSPFGYGGSEPGSERSTSISSPFLVFSPTASYLDHGNSNISTSLFSPSIFSPSKIRLRNKAPKKKEASVSTSSGNDDFDFFSSMKPSVFNQVLKGNIFASDEIEQSDTQQSKNIVKRIPSFSPSSSSSKGRHMFQDMPIQSAAMALSLLSKDGQSSSSSSQNNEKGSMQSSPSNASLETQSSWEEEFDLKKKVALHNKERERRKENEIHTDHNDIRNGMGRTVSIDQSSFIDELFFDCQQDEGKKVVVKESEHIKSKSKIKQAKSDKSNSLSVFTSPLGSMSRDDKTEFENSVVTPSQCKCKKSQCLKLYCDCFAMLRYCGPKCCCKECHNDIVHDDLRNTAIQATMQRTATAFKNKVTPTSAHVAGCNCSKSNCLKKYCECFLVGAVCGENCKCQSCKNFTGSAELKAIQSVAGGASNLASIRLKHTKDSAKRSREVDEGADTGRARVSFKAGSSDSAEKEGKEEGQGDGDAYCDQTDRLIVDPATVTGKKTNTTSRLEEDVEDQEMNKLTQGSDTKADMDTQESDGGSTGTRHSKLRKQLSKSFSSPPPSLLPPYASFGSEPSPFFSSHPSVTPLAMKVKSKSHSTDSKPRERIQTRHGNIGSEESRKRGRSSDEAELTSNSSDNYSSSSKAFKGVTTMPVDAPSEKSLTTLESHHFPTKLPEVDKSSDQVSQSSNYVYRKHTINDPPIVYPFFGPILPPAPKIVALKCLECLDGKDLYSASCVNKLWSYTAMDPAIWE